MVAEVVAHTAAPRWDYTLRLNPRREFGQLPDLIEWPNLLCLAHMSITPNMNPLAPDKAPTYVLMLDDIPEGERPRERFLQVGASGTSARELLAILLRIGPSGVGVLALADDLLRRFGGLGGLARANISDLQTVHGIGPVKAIEIKAALELGKRLAYANSDQKPLIRTPAEAAQMLMLDMGLLEQEEVRTMLLDSRNRILGMPMIYRGTLNAANMRLAEVFKEAIRQNAASVIVAHNHPSGAPRSA